MTKVDGSLKSLLQGVSQQPPRDRLAGQGTEQINMSSDPVSGLTRRAPTDLVGGLGVSTDVRGFHNFETRNGNKYLAYFRDGSVRVTDYNTTEIPVTINPDAVAYIVDEGKLVFTTVEDQVIIANRSAIPALHNTFRGFANKGPSASPMGIIQVLGGQYGREYRISMDGTTIGMYRPPDGSAAPMVNFIRTTHIAQRLFEAMTSAAGNVPDIDGAGSYLQKTGALAGAGWTVTRFEDCIWIRKNSSGVEFTLSASDDAGNVNLKTTTDTVPDIADMPRIAPHGYLLRVATETDPEEDMFLEFIVEGWAKDDGNTGTGFGLPGYWQETISGAVNYEMDTSTLPHVLEYDPETNTFELRRGTWKDRSVGTEGSNPDPSFIGNPINDISTFQSRLVFLSGSFVCMSRTNRFEDFWMGSASQLVDTDPIDISSTAVEASTMLAAIPHNRDLVIFSQKGQFVVFGRSALTPANATLVLTTAFEAELNAKPVPSGRNVFFATNYGRFTGVREFYTEGGTDINDTRPITQHIKKYIVGRVNRMIASSNYDTLLVQTMQDRDIIYVYQYIWNDSEKIQSSWSKWFLPSESVYMFFDEELIYFVLRKQTDAGMEHFLYRMSLDVYSADGVDYPIYLDSRFDVTDCYTSFVLPFDRLYTEELIAVQGLNCPNPGLAVPIKSVTFDAANDYYVVELRYSMEGGNIIVGIPFESSYRPTMPLIKDKDGVVMATAKLKVKKFICTLDQTGDINAQVLSKYGDGDVVSFQGRIVGAPDNIIGSPALSDDKFDVPFRMQTDQADVRLFTKRHLPMTILDIEWVGQFTKRGQRISAGE